MTSDDLELLRQRVLRRSGVDLGPEKPRLAEGRLRPLLAARRFRRETHGLAHDALP